MPTVLKIFDFDGTLFKSPLDTPENRKLYEKVTGVPWLVDKEQSRILSKKLGRFVPMRRGWWGQPATLEPPLVPEPAPKDWFIRSVCDQFFESKADLNTLTVIMTGRHAGLKKQVLRICKDGGLLKLQTKHAKGGAKFYEVVDEQAQIYFLGENGPSGNTVGKPGETLPWKLWCIGQFFEIYPEIEEVQIWEDREEHIGAFQEFLMGIVEKATVHHVKEQS